MAHESFEDPETAQLMNRLFVNIKVDREERPDLDKIYQSAHQLLAQRRCSPSAPAAGLLTLFLTPDDRLPFFAGTYFPRSQRHGLPAYLDDHAFLLDALLELLQTRWSSDDLHFARLLADALLEHFQDPASGFFFTADDHEELIYRPKSLGDDSTPSGNGVAAHALLRLGHLLGEPRYLDAAERTLRLAWPRVSRLPYAHGTLLKALDEWLRPTKTLVVRGSREELVQWRQRLPSRLAPRRFTLWIPNEAAGLPGLLAERKRREGVTAYLCSGTHCRAPVSDPRELERLIAGSSGS
jgi:uncharacterized protein YyaL (SSP411 family)